MSFSTIKRRSTHEFIFGEKITYSFSKLNHFLPIVLFFEHFSWKIELLVEYGLNLIMKFHLEFLNLELIIHLWKPISYFSKFDRFVSEFTVYLS